MSDKNIAGTFAVVRTGDSQLDNAGIARLMAEPLEMTVVDLIQVLPARSGIIVENLSEYLAERCVALLNSAGTPSQVVPQDRIVDPPEAMTLRSGQPGDEVFFFVAAQQKGVVKWSDVVWVDFVSVLELVKEEFDDWDVQRDDDRTRVQRFKTKRLVTKNPLFIDVVSHEPWQLLRIPQERFEFAATGLPTFPNRRENLTALAATIATKATEALRGPGLDWIESRSPPQEHRVASQALYRGYLRWQLTCRFLE